MAFLGLDQSYSGFGVTVINATTGYHETVVGKFDLAKYENEGHRLTAITRWLHEVLAGWDVDQVCMEGYAPGRKFGREQAGELGGQIKAYFHRMGLPTPTIVAPTAVKKFATGGGAAKKNEMLLAVYKRWNVEFKDDNAADSFVLAKIAEALESDSSDLTQFQKDVLSKLK